VRHEIATARYRRLAMTPGSHCEERCDEAIPRHLQNASVRHEIAAAAIGNAVYHATGKRIRELPITLDKLL
jgi:hypothetical protein